jgi:hypothetical protein
MPLSLGSSPDSGGIRHGPWTLAPQSPRAAVSQPLCCYLFFLFLFCLFFNSKLGVYNILMCSKNHNLGP